MRYITSDRRAFLLFEVMVSIVIVTVGILFVMKAYSSSRLALQRSRSATRMALILKKAAFPIEMAGEIRQGMTSGEVEGESDYAWTAEASSSSPGLNFTTIRLFEEKKPDDLYELVTCFRDKGA